MKEGGEGEGDREEKERRRVPASGFGFALSAREDFVLETRGQRHHSFLLGLAIVERLGLRCIEQEDEIKRGKIFQPSYVII